MSQAAQNYAAAIRKWAEPSSAAIRHDTDITGAGSVKPAGKATGQGKRKVLGPAAGNIGVLAY